MSVNTKQYLTHCEECDDTMRMYGDGMLFRCYCWHKRDPETRGPYCWRCNDDPYEQIWSEDGNTLISESLCVCQTV